MSQTLVKPAAYWRANQSWSEWLGRGGEVLAVTTIRVAVPELATSTPINYALVDFNGARRSFMVAGQEKVVSGDEVKCVLRKLSPSDEAGIIRYGIKIQKLS